MTTKTLLIIDTDILVDVGRHVQEAIDYLQDKEQQYHLATTIITEMELLIGARNKTEQRKVERFLKRFQIIKLDPDISNTAASLIRRYRLSHGLLIADAFIAATAVTNGLPLASKNQRDFRFIPQLVLLPYP